MKSRGLQRRLSPKRLSQEVLESRHVMAAQAFLPLDWQIKDAAINPGLDSNVQTAGTNQYRQLSIVSDNAIKTLGLHPQGDSLGTVSRSMTRPANAVDAVLEQAFDADTGVGFASLEGGGTDTILWLTPDLPISLGNVVPLDGYQRSDGSVVIAYESNPSIFVVQFSSDGHRMGSVTLDGEKYSAATLMADGMVLMGTENELPVAARINQDLSVTETSLVMPVDSTFAAPVGLSRLGAQEYYTGTSVDSAGQSRIVLWDLQGNLVTQNDFVDLVALKASGHAILVDTDLGHGVIIREPALASLLGVEVNVPTLASELAIIQNQNLTSATFTDLVQRDGELYLGVAAMDPSGSLIYGAVVAAEDLFPSPWHNYRNPLDVNLSGLVTPIDALLVINELNSAGARQLKETELGAQYMWDVNEDGYIAALDVLLIINYLNSPAASGESTDDGSASVPSRAHPLASFATDLVSTATVESRRSRRASVPSRAHPLTESTTDQLVIGTSLVTSFT